MLELTLWFVSISSLTQSIQTDTHYEHIVPLTKDFMKMLDDDERYNKYATPTQHLKRETNVSMSMYIEGISSFSAQTMDYQLDMYFYQEWIDERLKHNESGPLLIRDRSIFNKIWHPDIYFANARQASFQEITEDNFYVNIYPDGRVWYDCRISLVAICMMDLWKYPLDSQICELRILSYAYPETHLRLRWSKRIQPPIDRNLDIKMPDMKLVGITTGECNGTYATGVWSCMTAVFYVERAMLHHIIQTYVPTALIVIISWFNFWLDIDSAPARVSLSITTLLTIATQANAVKLALPEVSYMKAIDSWMGMCMAFVFAVMVEYTVAHFAKNQEHLFQFAAQQNVAQPPLVVDSETLNSILGAAVATQQREDPEVAVAQEEMERFITSEQMHRHWRKRVCGVLSNGRVMGEKKSRMRDSISARSYKSNQDGSKGENNEREPESDDVSTTTQDDDVPKFSRNHLSPEFYNIDDPRIKKLSRSMPEHFQYGGDQIPPNIQRKNSFRESARVIRNQVSERAKLIKRTLNQLRGREMANKIDQKSRILFPMAFIIMNLCYWSYYLILN